MCVQYAAMCMTLKNDIEPGTSFEDLPDDWVCPVCGASKDEFEKE